MTTALGCARGRGDGPLSPAELRGGAPQGCGPGGNDWQIHSALRVVRRKPRRGRANVFCVSAVRAPAGAPTPKACE